MFRVQHALQLGGIAFVHCQQIWHIFPWRINLYWKCRCLALIVHRFSDDHTRVLQFQRLYLLNHLIILTSWGHTGISINSINNFWNRSSHLLNSCNADDIDYMYTMNPLNGFHLDISKLVAIPDIQVNISFQEKLKSDQHRVFLFTYMLTISNWRSL